MGAHRGEPARPRYGRIALLASSVVVTAVAVLGGTGLLPSSSAETSQDDVASASGGASSARPIEQTEAARAGADSVSSGQRPQAQTALPDASGTGRRVVFSQSLQRVWLVDAGDDVVSTYLVSGSLTDNLQPGTYEVFSRSENAVGIDDSGTMRWFVRFTRGPSGAAIGFHTIPVDEGRAVQTVAQLGTPRSHGCIRQRTADAKRLWAFAPLGTRVTVVA